MRRHATAVRLAAMAVALAGAAGCASEFDAEPPVEVQIEPREPFPSTMTAGDARVFGITTSHARYGTLVTPRATWRSSNESILKVDAIPIRGNPDSAAVDTLSARRTRVQVTAVGAGNATITVTIEPAGGIAASERSFNVTILPLAYSLVRQRDSLPVTGVDTIEVSLSTSAPLRLTWHSSDASRARIEPLAFVGNPAADTLASRRLRMRVVALARGPVELVAGVEGGSLEDPPELRLPLTVLPLQIVPIDWPDTLAVADSVELAVRVIDAAGRAVEGLSIQWTSSDETSFPLAEGTPAGRQATVARIAALHNGAARSGPLPAIVTPLPTTATVWGAALRRDSIRIALRIDGLPTAEAALTRVPLRIMERWVDVSVGFENTCALSYDGRPYCWGQQTGGATVAPRYLAPTRISSAVQDLAVRFRRLVGGPFIACGESQSTAALWSCWGDNRNRIIGGAAAGQLPFAVALWPGVLTPRELVVGTQVGCAQATAPSFLDPVGTEYTWCWTQGSQPAMVRVHDCFNGISVLSCANNGELAGAQELATGAGFACASGPSPGVQGSNSFLRYPIGCWGANDRGQLGNDQHPGATNALPVLGLPGPMHSLVATGASACALTQAGGAYCWGFGYGPGGVPVHSGVSFDHLAGSKFNDIQTCGVSTSGQSYCWSGPAVLQAVAPGLGVERLRISISHKCAIRRGDGAIYCWGNNDAGQLGVGTLVSSAVPQRALEPAGRP